MEVKIGDRVIGAGRPAFLVAEIGINHNGDMALAREMIDAAAESGADSVKFQNYHTEDFLANRDLTHRYVSQGKTVVESQWDMFKRCELSRDDLAGLKAHCDLRGVHFHSTPTSARGIRELIEIGVDLIKNGSDYLTDLELVREMARQGVPVVLSTGMAYPAEIDDAVRVMREEKNDRLILLHCVSRYPTPPSDVHLRKIPALAATFGCVVGFSDHTDGTAAAVGAVTLGAAWIEKHFTLDRGLPGPDHAFSSDPEEFARLVRQVRELEAALGESRLGPTSDEAASRVGFRLSCTTATALPEGHRLTRADVKYQRPGDGIPPAQVGLLIGRKLRRAVPAGRVIQVDDLD